MPFYRCLLKGENFASKTSDGWELVGFYATRWVRAPNAKTAELRVISEARQELLFQKPADYSGELKAVVFLEEITKLRLPPLRRPGGATWFPMEAS